MVSLPLPRQTRRASFSGLALMRELLQSLPAAVAYVSGPDLVYEFANERFRQFFGGRELIGRRLREALPELDEEDLEAVCQVARSGQPADGGESELWIRRRGDAPEQFFIDFLCQPVRDGDGDVAGVLLYGSDVTRHVRDRRRLEELAARLAATESRYRTLFESMPQGVLYFEADGGVLEANPAAGEILGLAPGEMTSWPFGTMPRMVREDGSAYRPDELPGRAALRTGQIVADRVVGMPHGRTGDLRWLQVTAVPDARDEQGRPRRVFITFADITEQRQAEAAKWRVEQERAALLAREQAAQVGASAARERLDLLLRAGDLVAATRNPDDLLQQVTQLVVPALADYCVAFMPVPEGMLRATMLTDRDPAGAELLKRVREYPFSTEGPLLSQVAYTTATTQLAGTFNARSLEWTAAAPEVMSIAEQVDPVSALAVPLLAGGQHPLGVLVLGRRAPRHRFTRADVAVMEELARRLAAGLANVETFAREHTVAEKLQEALLPAAVPQIEGLDFAVRYLPASDGAYVGGDWYDAFPLRYDRIGLAIGDVAGHGIDSASIMGQVRSLLRGYAMDASCPADVLKRTDAAMCQLLPEAVATAFYAVLDPASGDLAYANAGHPPPLHASPDGDAEYLDDPPGIMLGTGACPSFGTGHRRLSPGARLLLYTDGLIEDRQRDIAEGFAALHGVVTRRGGLSPEQLCQSVQSALLGSAPRADDVCILAVRLLHKAGKLDKPARIPRPEPQIPALVPISRVRRTALPPAPIRTSPSRRRVAC